MARHDREDPHSLEDQLAWLDAIKEMPDEVDIAVSAVTASSLAAPQPAPPTDEVPSPYPKDPWRSVPAEPAPFRAVAAAEEPPASDSGVETLDPLPFGNGRGAFADTPVDTDSYNVGAFGERLPAEPDGSDEPVRGWLEPAIPVHDEPAESGRFPRPDAETGRFSPETVADLGRSSESDSGGFRVSRPDSDSGGFGFSRTEGDSGGFGFSRADEDSGAFGFSRTDTDRVSRPESDSGGFRVSRPDSDSGGFGRSDSDSGPFRVAPESGGAFGRTDFSRPDNESGRFSWPGTEAEETPAAEDTDPGDRFRPIRDADEPLRGSLRDNLNQSAEAAAGPGEAFRSSAREALESYTREVQPPLSESREIAEREPYQARRRQPDNLPAPAFTSTSRALVPRSTKPPPDSLDPATLLKGRKDGPATGWRRVIFKATAGLIKPGEAPEVRKRAELVARARTPVSAGHHRVAVLSLKGGVGKTTTTVGLGATLAQVRGDRVIAVDANPDRGTLSDKVELETSATIRDLLNERGDIRRYVDIRAFTSQTPSRLEILGSDRDPSVSEAFSAEDYQSVSTVLENFYSIAITDCGTGLLHSAMSGVLGLADQLVLVSSPSVDGARAASATLDWLEAHHYGDLVKSATVVLCSVRPRSKSTVDLKRLEAHFAARCRAVVRVPYDPHLEEGAEIDLERLQEPTRAAFLRLAACVGDGFAGAPGVGERRYSEIPDHI
ncbi:MinD/ParA family ATP-binding protein [Herbidospora mongoliensis]|uniref:MinD/ParA family ATP-binding protein n=1 Tax=Herbidospora mongoliensis TaxID=688067 RepID=UPI000A444472|nr:MinD/ParA family protein [Herbidospora mongoliensis]